jgi:hypothetical protein
MTAWERLAAARAGARPRRGFAGLGILALALAVDCGTVTPAAAAFSTDVVETTSGPVHGVAGFTVNKFLGLR